MTAATYFFTEAEFASRIGAQSVRTIFDDNQDGSADVDNVTALRRDATACVSGYMRGIYTLPLEEPVSTEVKRLALDVAVAYAAERYPEYVRRDWVALWDKVHRELCDVRSGKTRLDIHPDTKPSTAPANVGGSVGNTEPQETTTSSNGTTTTTPGSFWGDMGDF